MSDQIKIDNKIYKIVDEIDNIPIADSFVKNNKIQGTTGHGEAKLYVGAQQKRNFNDFFNGFRDKALFLKKDFISYLNDAKFEYEQQEQVYREDISTKWQEYYQVLQNLNEYEFFSIERAVPQDNSRYYIKSTDNIFDYFRTIAIPLISYISIVKLKDRNENNLFFFRPVLSYNFNPYYHPAKLKEESEKIEGANIPIEKKKQLVEARDGQGVYRKKLLEEKSECLICRVNDERLLVASHIKPWSVSNEIEKIDHYNGFALTPTYDKMFDQGFISFSDDGSIIISPYISPLNIKKLNLIPNKKYEIPNIEHRKKYLNYHREKILKK